MHHLQRLTFRRAIIMAQFSQHRSYYRTSHERCFGCPNHGRFLGGKQQLSNFHHLLKTNRPRWWEICSFNHFGFVISTDFKVVWTHGRHVHLFAASTMATCFCPVTFVKIIAGHPVMPLEVWRQPWKKMFLRKPWSFYKQSKPLVRVGCVRKERIHWINIPDVFGDEFMIIYVSCLCCFFLKFPNLPT